MNYVFNHFKFKCNIRLRCYNMCVFGFARTLVGNTLVNKRLIVNSLIKK